VPTTSEISHLRQLFIFAELTDADLLKILQAARSRRLDTGEFFFMQDDPAEAMYVLKSGRVKLLQITPDGQQVLLRMIGAWDLFAVVALIEKATYPVTAEAVENCEAFYWPKQTLLDLVRQIPGLAMNAMRLMAERLQEYQDRVRELSTERVERRLARAVIRLANQTGRAVQEGVLIDLPLSRQDLAEMTGTTLFTVSRILSQWEQQELVISGREKIIIRFPHGLVRIAEDLPPNPPTQLLD
jgi:CRP-like cAMP-binding protein